MNPTNIASLIWSIAELLRGDYKQSDYGKVIMPFTVLRRMDCVLEPTKDAVLAEFANIMDSGLPPEHFLLDAAGQTFFNSSPMDMEKLLGDAANLKANLLSYVGGFSENVRDIFEKFEFDKQIEKLDAANLLFLVVQKFAGVDLHPDAVPNAAMGHLFEELIRKFAELSNETAGDHFTPREVIGLMVDLLFIDGVGKVDTDAAVRTLYDPTAGTGGMLSVGEERLRSINPNAKLAVHGQELNPESYAICKADMLVKGQDVTNIVFGNTLSHDGHAGKRFDYMLSNPPFGVDWKKVEKSVRDEHEKHGFNGRFGPGLPRVSDGSLLFLMHLVSKMRDPARGGSRIGIVLNGSPLVTGGAGSGESEVRKHLFENDMIEAIVALPPDMFYNTGIGTYVWILSNKKDPRRQGKVQLIDGSMFWTKMRKSLGSKRKELSPQAVVDIATIYRAFADLDLDITYNAQGREVSRSFGPAGGRECQPHNNGRSEVVPVSKVLANSAFGYTAVTVERPLRTSFKFDHESAVRLAELAEGKLPSDGVAGVKAVMERLLGSPSTLAWREAEAACLAASEELGVALDVAAKKLLLTALEARDPSGQTKQKANGRLEADAELRDIENVPLDEDIDEAFQRDVLPHAPDAWIAAEKSRIGYEIPFNKIFYVFKPPRPLDEIDSELKQVSGKIVSLISELSS